MHYHPPGGGLPAHFGHGHRHIAPEDLPRIFEKGYTGENGRLERTSSGLGLYLAGKAAALLHIPITVDSRPGQGTTFTLHLRQEG